MTAVAIPQNKPIEARQIDDYAAKVVENLQHGSLEPALHKCNDHIEQGVQENFMQQRTAQGVPWAPRKNPNQILRVSDNESYTINNPILILSSRLLKSATDSLSPDAVIDIGERSMIRGTEVPYAHFLNEGTKKMPQREFMDVPEEFLKMCDEDIADEGLNFF